ncbi:hypothetical protein E3U43_017961, partial [Larimichthys crocea]
KQIRKDFRWLCCCNPHISDTSLEPFSLISGAQVSVKRWRSNGLAAGGKWKIVVETCGTGHTAGRPQMKATSPFSFYTHKLQVNTCGIAIDCIIAKTLKKYAVSVSIQKENAEDAA